LQRVKQTLVQQVSRHLIRDRVPGFDEHFVCDTLCLRGEDRHTNRREYVEVVRLSRQKGLAVVVDRMKLHAGRINRFALRPGIGLFRRALCMLGRIGESKDYRAFINPRHTFDNVLRECPADRAHPDDRGWLDALDSSDEISSRRVLVRVGFLEIDQVFAARFQKAVDVEHVDA